MRVLKQITSVGSLAFAIILALQPATSHAQTGFPSEASSSSQLEEMDQEIQTIFTRYLSADKDGFLHVNAEAINQDGKSLSEYQQIADGLNHNPYLNIDHEQDSSSSPRFVARSWWHYTFTHVWLMGLGEVHHQCCSSGECG